MKTEIWAIIKDVYRMTGDNPVTDQQIELVDLLDRYMRGIYKPVVKVVESKQDIVDEVVSDQPKRGRGRPKKS